LASSTTFTSRATFDKTVAVAGDKIVFTATNDGTALTSQTVTLTAADISAGFKDVTFAKPADGKVQAVTANYMDASGNAATDGVKTDSAQLDTTAPSNTAVSLGVSISTDANNDTLVNIAELASSTTFTSRATFDKTVAVAGDKIVFTATNDGTALTSQTLTLSQADIDAGFKDVTFAKPAEGKVQAVTANYMDASGNAATDGVKTDSAQLDTTAPSNKEVDLAITIATDANDDAFVNASELGAASKFTSHVSVNNKAVVGDKVVISATNGSTAQSSITRVLSSTDIANGFDVTFNKPADGEVQTVTANYVDVTGNAASDAAVTDSAKLDVSVPNGGTVPTVTISTDTNNDGTVNTTELNGASTFEVKGSFDGSKVAVGDKIVFSNGTSSNTVTLTQAMLDAGFATTTFAKPLEGGTLTVTAKLQDDAGNATPESASDSAKLDTSAPNGGTAPTVEITTDTNNDAVVNSTELGASTTFAVKASFDKTKVVAGDKVIFSDGTTTTEVVLGSTDITNGFATTTFAKPAEGGSMTVTAKLQDSVGNNSASASDTAALDTTPTNGGTAPTVEITTDLNNDGLVSISELNGASTFEVKGSFDKTKVVVGDKVVFSNGSSTNTVTLTQAMVDAGFALTTFAKPAEGGTLTVTAKVQDSVGNNTPDSNSDSAKLDTTAPTNSAVNLGVSISTDANNDALVSTAELNSATTFTSRATFDKAVAVAGDKIVLTATNDGTALSSQTVTLTAADIAAGHVDVTFAKPGDGKVQAVKANYMDASGNAASDTAPTDNAQLDTTAPTNNAVKLGVSITTDVNNDALVNIAELNSALTFTSRATFDKTVAAAGDKIVFSATNDGAALASQTVTLTAADIAAGYVDATFAKPTDGKVQAVKANYMDASGNAATDAAPTDSAQLDTTAPNNSAVNLAVSITTDADNDAFVSTAELASSATFTSRATFDKTVAVAGDKIVFSATNDGTALVGQTITLTAADISAGYVDVTFTKPAEGRVQAVKANYMDASGNAATDAAPTDTAQLDTTASTQIVTLSSMTKDSGLGAGVNADWTTNDASAGRLVSGFISATLDAGDVVNVYRDGTFLGTATVAAGGTTWAFTDTTAYAGGNNTASTPSAGWTYTAKVADAVGNLGTEAKTQVYLDLTEAPPVITAVYDSASTLVGNDPAATASNPATTLNTLSSISGTGNSGDTIYLYDNNTNNLVGTATVSNGTWTVTGPVGTFTGANTFSAKQVDANGNESVLSNLWTVSASGTNMLVNGDFNAGNTGFKSNGAYSGATNPVTGTGNEYTTAYDINNLPAGVNSSVIASAAVVKATNKVDTSTYTFGTFTNNYLTGLGNPNGRLTGKVMFGQTSSNSNTSNNADPVFTPAGNTSWSEKVNVVAGNTYTFSFDYAMNNYVGIENNSVYIDGALVKFAYQELNGGSTTAGINYSQSGNFSATYTATSTKTIELGLITQTRGSGGRDWVFDNFNFGVSAGANDNSLVAGTPVSGTSGVDAISYAGGSLSSLSGNDVITATGTDIQAKLSAGGLINGGAGVDTLKLAAGTSLNLEAMTVNQTVKTIEQVEIITLSGGGSKLTMSANDVLSLGGANASTMAAFTFSSTTLTPVNGVTPTSTSSTGKVQFVVNGQSGDTLNLDALANDGVTSTNGASSGLLGNTSLTGAWAYKGEFTISAAASPDGVAHTYKVYDHSTTQAQVLVDVPVTVNTLSPISITAISTDTGLSAVDFLTTDQTLVYTGQLPTAFNSASERVLVQLTDSNNVTTDLGFALVNGTNWVLDNQQANQAAGNYTIKATIVGLNNTTPVASYGALGTSLHALTIDTTTPLVSVSRSGSAVLNASATDTITFTLSEDSTAFNASDVVVTGGVISNFSGSGKSYTATFTPDQSFNGTATVGVKNNAFSDAAGNLNADTYESGVPGAVTEANNKVDITVDNTPPNGGTKPTVTIATDLNNDGIVNSAELGGATTFLVKGSFDNTKVVAGDKLVFSDGTTTQTVTLKAADITAGFATTTFAKPAEGGTLTVTVTVQDAIGNTTPTSDSDAALLDTTAPTQTVAFSSMTKDTGIASVANNNSDWLTSDASAGRLVSGTISAPLAADEVVVVFVDKGDGTGPQAVGTNNGMATVSGKAWEISDLNGYNASWTYSAKVFDLSGNSGTLKTQVVNADLSEAAPTITGVTDSGNAAVGATGTNATNLNPTSKTLNTVSGTGVAGDVIYLYDNSGTNLVGTTTVASNGTWTVTGLKGTFTGVNSFSAKQIDALGNESVLSNLWTVSATGTNQVVNGDFSNGLTGWTTYGTVNNNATSGQNFFGGVDQVGVMPASYFGGALTNRANSNFTKTGTSASGNMSLSVIADLNNAGNPDGRFVGNTFGWNEQTPALGHTVFLSQKVSVVAGNTYSFSFDMQGWQLADVRFYLGDTFANFGFDTVVGGTSYYQLGKVSGTFTASTTGLIDMAFTSENQGDLGLDNLTFSLNATAANNSLTPGGTAPATPGDNTLSYTGGNLHALGGNDVVISVGSDIQSTLSSGGFINGGAGVDTLKLAAGTNLNLETLTGNQSVKPIQEVEVFQMQGGSTLTLSTNDVLSLGGVNLAGFSFTSTTGGTASTSSTGKVQFVVKATDTDLFVLDALQTDGVTTNGTVGNTGLTGQWDYMGTTTIGGTVYKVFNSSNTAAQVLTTVDPEINTNAIAFSSMTKDSGPLGTTNDWLTSDVTAGRLVSGTVATPLAAGDKVNVYANGTLIGTATVNAAGTAWEITDINGYNGNWVYSANVVSASGTTSATAFQPVRTDVTESAPTITGVMDTANASVLNAGTTTNALSTVRGTGNAGDLVYLYDNTIGNLVGTAIVGADGSWSVANLVTGAGANTFSAKQVDAQGNQSVLSNLWTVTAAAAESIANGDFVTASAFTSGLGTSSTGTNYNLTTSNYAVQNPTSWSTVVTTNATTGTLPYAFGTWQSTFVLSNTSNTSRLAAVTGNALVGSVVGAGTTWSSTVNVVKGQAYEFNFDYSVQYATDANTISSTALAVYIDGVRIDVAGSVSQVGHFKATYIATETGSINLSTWTDNTRRASPEWAGDYIYDNFSFKPTGVANNSTLVAATAAPSSSGDDALLVYMDSPINALAGNDTINVGMDIQSKLVTGFINGGAGVDTLKLAAGSNLNLETLTTHQTVKAIQEVEVFQMQGASSLTLSTNDVLSLGATNLAGFSFTSTTGGSASTSSTGKVQFVVKATDSDLLVLDALQTDGVTTNGTVGNTGLTGQWDYMGTTTIGGTVYKVFNSSNTAAQVLTTVDPEINTNAIAFSSMTKDSGPLSTGNDWLTSDVTAGRLVSGTVATPLAAGDKVNVYANGTLIGTATVNAAGTAWEITDTNGYSGNWVYSANVVSASGKTSATAFQPVRADLTEGAPVITSVLDSVSTSIANAGTSANALSSVSGTGNAGDTIYLYDNTSTNLVGTTTVGANGTWTVTGLAATVGDGSNTFAAVQVDSVGNASAQSNLWTVGVTSGNLISNGTFTGSTAGWTLAATGAGSIAPVLTNGNPNQIGFNGSDSAPGGVASQLIRTVSGKSYRLTLDAGEGGGGVGSHTILIEAVDASGKVLSSWTQLLADGSSQNIPLDFVATSASTTIRISNTAPSITGSSDMWVDNVVVLPKSTTPANSSLVAGQALMGSNFADNLTYNGTVLNASGGNDVVITVGTDIQSTLTSGGFISGGTGVDTLKLAAGTNLNLETLTANQTVKAIQEVEVVQMQGTSTLTLSTNDVLSLGGTNLAGYSFASTTGGTASTSSTGKVQFVVKGALDDLLVLDALQTDGVTTNGTVGNTGLTGQWDYMGTTTIGGTVYKVFNSSNTAAQVLTTVDPEINTNAIAFSSMTKDSGPLGTTNDWLTSDVTAGRLVSGTVATPLAAGDKVNVYANGTLIGTATVNAAGTAWEITDINGYSGNWVYSANVVSASGTTSATAFQPVRTDLSEAAPVITSVVDSASVSVSHTGTTTNAIASVSGTGAPGDVLFLFDNSTNNLVASTVVAANGTWTVSGSGIGLGSNTLAAKQYDLMGNPSGFSNLWTVNASGLNLVPNGDFNNTANYTSDVPLTTTSITYDVYEYGVNAVGTVAGPILALTKSATNSGASAGGSALSWYTDSLTSPRIGTVSGWDSTRASIFGTDIAMQGSVTGTQGLTTLYKSGAFDVVKGQTYKFTFNYYTDDWKVKAMTAIVDGVEMALPARVGAGETEVTTGKFTATYTANESKSINITMVGNNQGNGISGGDFWLDDINFQLVTPSSDNSLVAGGTSPASSGSDTVTLIGGVASPLAGDDTIVAGSDLQARLLAGGFINGGAGNDTLKLAAGTALDLTKLTSNQTVKSIQEVEVVEMQGTSTLTLSANNVLSLGQANAFTTNGKVQLMIKGTSTDAVALQNLLSDGAGGNTGLDGMWVKDSSTVSINSVTFNVYNHSTTKAQVLIQATIPDTKVTVSASPLVLDLNGDGVQTTDLAHGTQFDLFNSGSKQNLGWVDKHDGLLAIDLNHDGKVNNGSELLGTSTKLADGTLAKDGWQALAQYDKNADGVIDAQDAVFKDLQVWVDGNADGVSGAAEVKTLADLGIQSIHLNHDKAQTTQNGNVLQGLSSYTTTDGQTHEVTDAWFNTQAADSATPEVNTFKLLDMGMTLDLTAVTRPTNVEVVDLSNGANAGHNMIKMDLSSFIGLSDVLDNPATSGVDESKMLVVNGHAGDSAELTDSLNWNTVMTSQTAATLSSTFGEAYHFVPGHTYSQLNQNGATLFIDEAITRNTHG
ncbi:MAG: hypothetical protein CFE39_13655, partial [Comamonadaceae bacterium PBBC2]